MVYRVVSTKLTEEEHTKLLDLCNRNGCAPSALIKEAIMEKIETESKPKELKESLRQISEKNKIKKAIIRFGD